MLLHHLLVLNLILSLRNQIRDSSFYLRIVCPILQLMYYCLKQREWILKWNFFPFPTNLSVKAKKGGKTTIKFKTYVNNQYKEFRI